MVVEIAGQYLQTEVSSHFLLCNVNIVDPSVLEMGTQQGEQEKNSKG